MRGVELSPASALVRPYREAMFCAYDIAGPLVGLMVGARESEADDWQPAIHQVTLTCVVSCGRRLHHGPWRDLIARGDIGWPLFGSAESPFVVYVRNDRPVSVELRAVVVLKGDGDRARPARLRLRR